MTIAKTPPGAASVVYAALGGSMSVDEYPAFDLEESTGRRTKSSGAASLLYRNDDESWPEFKGRDFFSRGYTHFELCARDTATLSDVLDFQLRAVSATARTITVTTGGNDLLHILAVSRTLEEMREREQKLEEYYGQLIEAIHSHASAATLVCTTIYDPTDGTGLLREGGARVPIELLHEFNESIRKAVRSRKFAMLADVEEHFRGHGITASGRDRWYWKGSMIEPSARGASEIRRVWADALGL